MAKPPTWYWSTPVASWRRPSRTRSRRCSPPRTPVPRSWPPAAWPSGTARELAHSLPEAHGGARVRRLPGHLGHPRRPHRRPAGASTSHVPRDRRTLLPLTPVAAAGRRRGVCRRPRDASTSTPGAPATGAATAAGQGAGRLAQAGQSAATGAARSAPSRRSAARSSRVHPDETAGRGGVAGPARGPRAGTGQRELHVVRQGPRRSSGCWRSCCRSWRPSTASSGCG